MYNNELKIIYNNLKSGETYGYFSYWNYYNNIPVSFPCFHTVLSKHEYKNLFLWTHFGSSANKATMKDLHFIIYDIFKMTAKEFLYKYMTYTEFDRMKKAIKQNGID